MSESEGEPRSIYRARQRARRETVVLRRRSVDRISSLRLLTFAVAAAQLILAWRDLTSALWLLLPGLCFVVLVVLHERAYRAVDAALRAVRHYQAGLRRIDDAWVGHGITGEALAPAEHPYAADLDLFGEGSLFELLCTARTASGRETLARWMLRGASLDRVRQRQQAVEQLRTRVDLREALALAGDELDVGLDPAELSAWGTAPALLDAAAARRWRLVTLALPVASITAAAGWALGLGGGIPLAVTLGLTWVAGRLTADLVRRSRVAAERSARQLDVLARVLACLEGERFEDPHLTALRGELVDEQRSAARQIRTLALRLRWAEAADGQLFAPIAFALLWRLRFTLSVEAWRAEHGPRIEAWLAALGELEALAALSAYAFEHPDDPFPTLVEGEPVLEGEDLGHPLLPASQCVRNPVSLGGSTPGRIVSGSNMSGKSTYLRTVGINVVLALMGAPVRARSLRLSALRIGATLRVQDSLQGGASRFFAEITRLRTVVALADEGPGTLFLLDEILHGTNSHDRRIGGHAIVQGLLDRGAIGLVTTHDLALAAGQDDPRVDNLHFCDELRDGRLRFDYRLRPGVVKTSNALALMEAVGLPVPTTPQDEAPE